MLMNIKGRSTIHTHSRIHSHTHANKKEQRMEQQPPPTCLQSSLCMTASEACPQMLLPRSFSTSPPTLMECRGWWREGRHRMVQERRQRGRVGDSEFSVQILVNSWYFFFFFIGVLVSSFLFINYLSIYLSFPFCSFPISQLHDIKCSDIQCSDN